MLCQFIKIVYWPNSICNLQSWFQTYKTDYTGIKHLQSKSTNKITKSLVSKSGEWREFMRWVKFNWILTNKENSPHSEWWIQYDVAVRVGDLELHCLVQCWLCPGPFLWSWQVHLCSLIFLSGNMDTCFSELF